MKKVLLDTNAYSALLNGNKEIFRIISKAEVTYLSVIVIGELFAGFNGGSNKKDNINLLNEFLDQSSVKLLEVSFETASIFGSLKHDLKKEGTPIPLNDVWIASQSIETGSVLVTLDAHFKKVKGLRMCDLII